MGRVERAIRLTLACCAFLALATLLTSSAGAAELRIVALGDSLTAGFGLKDSQSFPTRLQAALVARGHDVEVINAGVSGDTAAGGAARVGWSVGPDADAAIVEFGGNDALRGLDPAVTRQALTTILDELSARNIPALLAGMRAPPNLGTEYGAAFDAIFADLSARPGVIFYPFFLDGVAAEPALTQEDGLHPNAAGVEIIVARILPSVETLIAAARR